MTIDLYTKIVLTVIATSLVVLVVRPFQSPTSVAAQQTHLEHVIIDDLGPHFSGSGLPVSPGTLGRQQHVIIDGVDHDLAPFHDPLHPMHAIPVSVESPAMASLLPLPKPVLWQYVIDGCSMPTLNKRGLDGWELVQPIWETWTMAKKSPPSGPAFTAEFDKLTSCYFKKPLG